MISSGFLILPGFRLQRLQADKDFRFLFQDFHPLPQMAFLHLFSLSFLILLRIPCIFCGREVHLIFRFLSVFHGFHSAVLESQPAVLESQPADCEFFVLWILVSLFVFQFFHFFRTVGPSFFQSRGVHLQVIQAVSSSCLKGSIFKKI